MIEDIGQLVFLAKHPKKNGKRPLIDWLEMMMLTRWIIFLQ